MTALPRRTFLAAGLGALGLAACGNPPRAYPADSRPADSRPADDAEPSRPGPITSVGMVGDSITRGSLDELEATFAGAGITETRIDGETGRRIEVGNGKGSAPLSGVGTLYGMLAEGLEPDAWVIALGTNDVGSYPSPEAYADLIDLMLGMLPVSTPLVWVNTYRRQYLEDTNVFNLVLQQRINDRPNALVVDWFAAVTALDADLLRSDDIHPNAQGQLVFAMLVVDALQRV
jgi:lysophospholipase L1-like esterase